MQKREAKFDTQLQKWLTYNPRVLNCENAHIETKVIMNNMPFNFKSGFKPHQLPTLIQARQGVFTNKWSDIGRIQQPFDITFSYQTHTWVVLKWERRGNKKFYFLNPITIQGMIDDGKKSIYEEEAEQYADIIGELGVIHNANISQT